MKLLIVAALIAVSSAARLEHLERSYLPPTQGSQGSQGAFGSNSGSGFGGSSPHGSFGLASQPLGSNSGSFGSNGFGAASRSSFQPAGAFPGATSNQYLPPNHGSSGSNGLSNFGSSGQGPARYQSQQYSAPQPQSNNQYGSQQAPRTQYGSPQQYSAPSTQYGTPQFGSSAGSSGSPSAFGAQSRYQPQSQLGAASRQYLTPKSTPNFQSPQQPFDEETGYHY